MRTPSFPTEVKADEGIVERWAKCRPAHARQVEDDRGKFLHVVSDIPGLMATLARAGDMRSYEGSSWRGIDGVADALHLAEFGWRECVEDILEQSAMLETKKTNSLIPYFVEADEPGEVDVSAYLSGETDCFLNTSEGSHGTPAAGRAVRIVIEPTVSAGVSTRDLVTRGSLVASLAHILERSGVRVSIEFHSLISWMDGAGRNQEDCQIDVVLKKFGVPLDLNSLAFWLIHPAASRMFMFAACNNGRAAENIGWSSRSPKPEADWAYMGRMHSFEHSSIADWTAKAFASAGIEVK